MVVMWRQTERQADKQTQREREREKEKRKRKRKAESKKSTHQSCGNLAIKALAAKKLFSWRGS